MLREVACTFSASEVFDAQIELDLDPGCGPLAIPTGGLFGAFVELTLNAFEAMSVQDRVTLRLRQITVAASWRPELGLASGEHACVHIEDTGSGMPPEVLGQAFSEGFTTRAHARGVGLNVALSAVRAAGGAMHVTSAPHRGTCVSVYLPIEPG
jgi:signal transduction histidine kinase